MFRSIRCIHLWFLEQCSQHSTGTTLSLKESRHQHIYRSKYIATRMHNVFESRSPAYFSPFQSFQRNSKNMTSPLLFEHTSLSPSPKLYGGQRKKTSNGNPQILPHECDISSTLSILFKIQSNCSQRVENSLKNHGITKSPVITWLLYFDVLSAYFHTGHVNIQNTEQTAHI